MPLFAFLAQGVVGETMDASIVGYRPGHRHALLVFSLAESEDEAAGQAVARVEAHGWLDVTILRRRVVEGLDDLTLDETVKSIAESALEDGVSYVIYGEPIPHDA